MGNGNRGVRDSKIGKLSAKLDGILALLVRQMNDEGLTKWNNLDRPNMVRALIDVGLDNHTISRVVGMKYGSVANIKTNYSGKTNKKKKKAKTKK